MTTAQDPLASVMQTLLAREAAAKGSVGKEVGGVRFVGVFDENAPVASAAANEYQTENFPDLTSLIRTYPMSSLGVVFALGWLFGMSCRR